MADNFGRNSCRERSPLALSVHCESPDSSPASARHPVAASTGSSQVPHSLCLATKPAHQVTLHSHAASVDRLHCAKTDYSLELLLSSIIGDPFHHQQTAPPHRPPAVAFRWCGKPTTDRGSRS